MNSTNIRKIALIDKDGRASYINVDPDDEVTVTLDVHPFEDIKFENGELTSTLNYRMTNGQIAFKFSPSHRDSNVHECNTIGDFINELYC